MKSADLKPGLDYAYVAWKRAQPVRVTVAKVGVTGVDSSGFGGRGKPRGGLVRVANATGPGKGEEFNVRPQTLTKTWSHHHGEQVALGVHRAAQKRSEQAERERRAALAYTMHQRLLTAGAPMELVAVYDDEDREALLKAGFHPVPNISYHFAHEVFSAVQALDELMDEGVVSLDDVAVLIDEAVPTLNPKYDGLGSWDSEAFDPEDWAVLEAAYFEASKAGRP